MNKKLIATIAAASAGLVGVSLATAAPAPKSPVVGKVQVDNTTKDKDKNGKKKDNKTTPNTQVTNNNNTTATGSL